MLMATKGTEACVLVLQTSYTAKRFDPKSQGRLRTLGPGRPTSPIPQRGFTRLTVKPRWGIETRLVKQHLISVRHHGFNPFFQSLLRSDKAYQIPIQPIA
jgi:hypothetical protein